MPQLFVSPLHITLIYLAVLSSAVILTSLLVSCAAPSIPKDGHLGANWLDGLRGLAAMLVSLNHAPFALISQGASPKAFYFPLEQHEMFRAFGATGVQIFFCITGALFAPRIIMAADINWTDFFGKRIRRIVPAYCAAAVISLAVTFWAIYPNPLDPFSITRALPSLFSMGLMPLPRIAWFDMAQLIGVNWSLGIEWMFYLTLPVLFVMARKNVKLTLAALVLWALADAYLTMASTWAFFVVGALVSGWRDRQFSAPARAAAYVVGALALAYTVRHWSVTPEYGLSRLIGMGVVVASIFVAKPWVLRTRAFVTLGTASYSFYLLHVLCIFVVSRCYRLYVGDIGTLTVRQYAMLTGLALAVAVVAASTSYVFIERPFMKPNRKPKGVLAGPMDAVPEVMSLRD